MSNRRTHRLIGIILMLPLTAWSLTAIFFLARPGYDEAYERLSVRTYPLETLRTLDSPPEWQELRLLRTLLGTHLLIREGRTWQHLDANTLTPFPPPEKEDLRRLLADAFTSNPDRYGSVLTIEDGRIVTDTGVVITLDWNNLAFSQNGRDTRWIDRVYSIHYLEWTGIGLVDRFLGLGGLALLLLITCTGARMAFRPMRRPHNSAYT